MPVAVTNNRFLPRADPGGGGASPGGPNLAVQFNDAGAFGGDADFTYDGAGNVRVTSSLTLVEVPGDPAAVANEVPVYVKDVAGVSQLFSRSDDGTVHQLTPGASPGGANTNVQFNDAGAFGGDGGFTYNPAAGAGTPHVQIGTAALRRRTDVNIPDNDGANPYEIAEGANVYFAIRTANGDESMQYGNNTTAPRHQFNGNLVTLGSGGSARLNVTNITPDTFEAAHAINIGQGSTALAVNIGRATQNLTVASTATILGGAAPVGAERLRVVGDARIEGKLTVTGAIDPTNVDLTTGTALWFGSTDGSTAPVSPAGSGRLRYNNGLTRWEASVNGGAYAALGGAPGGANLNVQFNASGAFGGSADFTWNDVTKRLFIGGSSNLDVVNIEADPGGGGHAINIGAASPTTTVTIGRTGQVVNHPGGTNLGTATGAGNGQLRMSGDFRIGGNIDRDVAGSLSIGGANATTIQLGRTGQQVTLLGSGLVTQAFQTNNTYVHNAGGTFTVNVNAVANAFRVLDGGGTVIEYDAVATRTIRIGPVGGGTAVAVRIAPASVGLLGFFGAAAVARYGTTGTVTGFTAGIGTPVNDSSTFTGDTGATAYTIGDLVRCLKLYGLMAS